MASQETVARIQEIAAQLNYQPNPHATSLRTRRSGLVGVLVPSLTDLVLASIYEGVEQETAKVGLSTFVTNTHDRLEQQRSCTDMMLSRRVDGLIFGDAHLDGRFLHEVSGHGVPFVLVNRRTADHPSVTCDDYLGGRLAAEHLLNMGHEKVAVLAGEPHASTGVDRTAGFVDRFHEAGIKIPRARIVHTGFDASGGREGMETLLSHRNRPTAVFAVNDFTAIGTVGALRDHGIRLSEEVAVIGYNDTPLAAELPVPLTSVRSPMREMGERAARMLSRLLTGEQPDSERLEPSLAIRASSDPSLLSAFPH